MGRKMREDTCTCRRGRIEKGGKDTKGRKGRERYEREEREGRKGREEDKAKEREE